MMMAEEARLTARGWDITIQAIQGRAGWAYGVVAWNPATNERRFGRRPHYAGPFDDANTAVTAAVAEGLTLISS